MDSDAGSSSACRRQRISSTSTYFIPISLFCTSFLHSFTKGLGLVVFSAVKGCVRRRCCYHTQALWLLFIICNTLSLLSTMIVSDLSMATCVCGAPHFSLWPDLKFQNCIQALWSLVITRHSSLRCSTALISVVDLSSDVWRVPPLSRRLDMESRRSSHINHYVSLQTGFVSPFGSGLSPQKLLVAAQTDECSFSQSLLDFTDQILGVGSVKPPWLHHEVDISFFGVTSASGCFSGGSWKALSPDPLTRCSIQFGFLFIVTYSHSHLCLSSISNNHLRFITPRFKGSKVDEQTTLKEWTWSIKRFIADNPSSSNPNTMKINSKHACVNLFGCASILKIYGGFIRIYFSRFMSYLSFLKNLPVGSSGSVLSTSSSSLEEKTSLPPPLPMERDVSSVLLPSVCFSFLISLSSCVAVSTGPEDAIEITLRCLVDEVWTSTSLYVTILQLSDFVVKASRTHSSIVLNSLSSSVEDLSFLSYLCVVFYVYGQRRWIIPSFSCMEED